MEVDVSGVCCRVYTIDKSTLYFLRSPVVFFQETHKVKQPDTFWEKKRRLKRIKMLPSYYFSQKLEPLPFSIIYSNLFSLSLKLGDSSLYSMIMAWRGTHITYSFHSTFKKQLYGPKHKLFFLPKRPPGWNTRYLVTINMLGLLCARWSIPGTICKIIRWRKNTVFQICSFPWKRIFYS